MSFGSEFGDFTAHTLANYEQLVRGSAIGLFSRVIKRTPVKTGRLRGNWQTDINQPKSGELDRKGASAAIAEVVAEVQTANIGDSIYMVNNLPYASVIENGSSTQAPQGVVKVSVLEFEAEVERQAAQLR